MLNNPNHKAAGQNIFMSSMIGLANVLAVVITFLCTPMLHAKTQPWVQQGIFVHYGGGDADIVNVCWFIISA